MVLEDSTDDRVKKDEKMLTVLAVKSSKVENVGGTALSLAIEDTSNVASTGLGSARSGGSHGGSGEESDDGDELHFEGWKDGV